MRHVNFRIEKIRGSYRKRESWDSEKIGGCEKDRGRREMELGKVLEVERETETDRQTEIGVAREKR